MTEPQRNVRGMSEQRLDWHMDNWCDWQRDRAGDFEQGRTHRASGGLQSNASRDFDSMVAEVDRKCALAVDAIIDELPAPESAAVYHFHLGAVFRFPRIGQGAEIAYSKARVAIRAGMLRRGIE